jgi:hypothetical protein
MLKHIERAVWSALSLMVLSFPCYAADGYKNFKVAVYARVQWRATDSNCRALQITTILFAKS